MIKLKTKKKLRYEMADASNNSSRRQAEAAEENATGP
jgi:hypothetical protein